MEFFTGLGIVIVCVLVSTLFYKFITVVLNIGDDEANGLIAFIMVATAVSIIFALFMVDPESYGYQKIVSGNEVVSE